MTISLSRLRRWTHVIILSAILGVPAFSDVIFLVDGKILIGSIIGPDEGGVAYTVFGERVVLGVDRILKTEKTIQSLAELPVSVLLRDGSTIRGKIVDYEEEIGLFVDIGFGVLTVPIAAISEIVDAGTRTRYAGSASQFRLGGGMYMPLLAAMENFGPSWSVSGGGIFSMPFLRGLFGGLSVSLSGADFLSADTVRYMFLTFAPAVEFHFLGWRMRDDFLGSVTPFVGAQAGATFISLSDPSAYPSDQGSLTASAELSAGVDLGLPAGFVIRLDLYGSMIMQNVAPFLTAGARLFVCYEL